MMQSNQKHRYLQLSKASFFLVLALYNPVLIVPYVFKLVEDGLES